jgi:hypothetical protein
MAPVVGPVTGAVLVAAVGNPASYPDTASYLKALPGKRRRALLGAITFGWPAQHGAGTTLMPRDEVRARYWVGA